MKNEGVRLPIITERFLTMMLRYLATVEAVTKRSLNNIARLIAVLDHKHYQRDVAVAALLKAIEITVKDRFDGFDKDSLLMKFESLIPPMYNEVKEGIIYPTLHMTPLGEKDCLHVDTTIETYLKYSYVFAEADTLIDITTDMRSGIANIEASIQNFQKSVQSLHENFRNADNSSSFKKVVHMHEDDYQDIFLKDTFKKAKSPKSFYKMGLQFLNNFLSGEGGLLPKYYIFYADINSFKSTLLMYFAKWIQKYNSEAFVKRYMETGKRPTVLMVSLENSQDENIQRYFSMYTAKSLVKMDSFDNTKRIWNECWNSENSIIDIALLHEDSNTMKVSDIDSVCDQLYEDGYEVIGVCLDYLELLAPDDRFAKSDLRYQLWNISDNLFKLSKRRGIPVITAQQLNREGSKVLFEARERGDLTGGQKISRHNVGESHGIEKPADFTAVITLEKFKDEVYLTFKRIKCRYGPGSIDNFVHKLKYGFVIEDDIKMEKPTSLNKIMEDPTLESAFALKDTGRRGIVSRDINSSTPPTLVENPNIEVHQVTPTPDIEYDDSAFIAAENPDQVFDLLGWERSEEDGDDEFVGSVVYDLTY